MEIWIIEDWAGNRKFPDRSFDSFMDATYFLQTRIRNDDDLEEFYVASYPVPVDEES